MPQRLEQQLDPFLRDQLPEVDDGRLVAREECPETLGVALVGQALVAAARVRRVGLGLGDQLGKRLGAFLQDELVDVDARRHLDDPVDVTDDVLEHVSDVLRADVYRLRGGQHLAPQRSSSGRPRIEYSSSEPCALTRNGSPSAAPTGPPISTWLAKTRSAGSPRSTAAFAST